MQEPTRLRALVDLDRDKRLNAFLSNEINKTTLQNYRLASDESVLSLKRALIQTIAPNAAHRMAITQDPSKLKITVNAGVTNPTGVGAFFGNTIQVHDTDKGKVFHISPEGSVSRTSDWLQYTLVVDGHLVMVTLMPNGQGPEVFVDGKMVEVKAYKPLRFKNGGYDITTADFEIQYRGETNSVRVRGVGGNPDPSFQLGIFGKAVTERQREIEAGSEDPR